MSVYEGLAAPVSAVSAPVATGPSVVLDQARHSERVDSAACVDNALTIDVEEYFHAEVFAQRVDRSTWPKLQRRAATSLERIAQLLERHEAKATFFVLGWTVEYLAPLLRHLASQGHEIASHGFAHQHLSRMTPETLRDDLEQSIEIIEDRVGVRPRGYRAPTFSVTRQRAWALDVIIDAGFSYDSSIYPIVHDRYGVPNAPLEPFDAIAPSGRRLPEFPPLTTQFGSLRLPTGGGGYLRLLPTWVIEYAMQQARNLGRPSVLYVHPWELDPDQPRLPMSLLSRWRHHVNLARTEAKLDHLLSRHAFTRLDHVVRQRAQSAQRASFTL